MYSGRISSTGLRARIVVFPHREAIFQLTPGANPLIAPMKKIAPRSYTHTCLYATQHYNFQAENVKTQATVYVFNMFSNNIKNVISSNSHYKIQFIYR